MAFLTRRVGLAIASALIGALAFGSQVPSPASAQGRDVVVFAAASLKNALDEITAPGSARTRARRRPISLRGELGARQADRGRARRPTSSSPPTSTGWTICAEQEPDRPETRVNLLGNQHRAGRAEGRQDQPSHIAPGLRPRRGARRRQARDGQRRMRCRPASTARRRWRSSASGTA